MAGVIAAYFVGTITQNILAIKTFEFHGVSTVAGGVLLTWLAFASGDIITEILGRKAAIRCILIGAATNLLFCGICAIAVALPGNNPYVAECYPTQDNTTSNTLYERTRKYGWGYENDLTAGRRETYTDALGNTRHRPNIQPFNYVLPIPNQIIESNKDREIKQNYGYK